MSISATSAGIATGSKQQTGEQTSLKMSFGVIHNTLFIGAHDHPGQDCCREGNADAEWGGETLR